MDECQDLESEVDATPYYEKSSLDSKSDGDLELEVEVRKNKKKHSNNLFNNKESIEEKHTGRSNDVHDCRLIKSCQSLLGTAGGTKSNDVLMALRVLIVDDAKSNRKMMSRLLSTRYLLSEEEACDGLCAIASVAIAMHKNVLPDVIFMDFVMPNMDGPTATQLIRSMGYKGLIVGVTGNALLSDIELFLSQGASKVMTKPFNMESFESFLAGKLFTK